MADLKTLPEKKPSKTKDKKSRKRKAELDNIAIDAEKQEDFIEKVKLLSSEVRLLVDIMVVS